MCWWSSIYFPTQLYTFPHLVATFIQVSSARVGHSDQYWQVSPGCLNANTELILPFYTQVLWNNVWHHTNRLYLLPLCHRELMSLLILCRKVNLCWSRHRNQNFYAWSQERVLTQLHQNKDTELPQNKEYKMSRGNTVVLQTFVHSK